MSDDVQVGHARNLQLQVQIRRQLPEVVSCRSASQTTSNNGNSLDSSNLTSI